jgi:methionyl-tRNA formyltransferase
METVRTTPPTALFFGMAGAFSVQPLRALIAAGITVRAVVMPSPMRLHGDPPTAMTPAIVRRETAGHSGAGRRALPLLGGGAIGENIAHVAATEGIPLLVVSRLHDARTLVVLASTAPDLICVACFPWRLPRAVLVLPRLGCLNLHPSLLPRNRGPDPLFWTFRRGAMATGVTVHLMDKRLDAGPILARRLIPVPLGMAEAELERVCAQVGGVLLAQSAWALAHGSARPRAQDETHATRFPTPRASDFLITPDRPARWAHGFACGVVGRGVPLRARLAGQMFRVRESLGFDDAATLPTPWRWHGDAIDALDVRCTPGVWHVRAALEANQG